MKIIRSIFIPLIFALVFCFFTVSTAIHAGAAEEKPLYRGELNDLSIQFYEQGDVDHVLEELSRRERELDEGGESFEGLVALAEIEVFRGEIKEVRDADSPRDNFERAYELAEKALDKKETGRAARLAVESLSQLFDYRGTFFIIRNAGQAEDYLEKMEELSGDRWMSELVMASFLLSAPERVGGDRDRGREILQQIKEAGHPVLNLAALNVLAGKYEEDGEEDKVEELRLEALDIYPDSPWLDKFPLR